MGITRQRLPADPPPSADPALRLPPGFAARLAAVGARATCRPGAAAGADVLAIAPACPVPPAWTVALAHGGGNDRLFGLWVVVEGLLAAGLAIVTADLPGHGAGASDHFTLPAARLRLDALVAAAGPGPVAVLGHSLGGALALDRLARGAPEPVVAASVPLELALGPGLLVELAALARPELRQLARDLGWAAVLPAIGPFNRARYPLRVPPGTAPVQALAAAIAGLDLEARLAQTAGGVPALIVHGDRDAIAPISHGRRLAAALGADAAYLPVAGAGHGDVLLRLAVVQAIASWLPQCGAAMAM